MNAISLLKNQHRKVEALFKKLEGGRSDPQTVMEELSNSLAAHMAIEHEFFYPGVKEVDEEMVNESFEEHSLAEVALKRLLATDPEDEAFAARVTALKELIQHHVEEEEQELFPEVEKAVSEETLNEMGKLMKRRFDEVFANGFEATVPRGMTKTSADVDRKKIAKKTKRAA
jgi:hemerythrin-like domain-containing protein